MVVDFSEPGPVVFISVIIALTIALAGVLVAAWLASDPDAHTEGKRKVVSRLAFGLIGLTVILGFAIAYWPSGESAVAGAKPPTETAVASTTPTETATPAPAQIVSSTPTQTPTPTQSDAPATPSDAPSLASPSAPVRFELVVDTPTVAAAGGGRVGTNRFQLDDWGDEGPLVQVSPAWTAFSSDGSKYTEQDCDLVVKVDGPEKFGPWYSAKCTKSSFWNGFGDANDSGTSEISLPGQYTLTLTDEKSGISTSLDFEVVE